MEPVEINAGTFYLRQLRHDDRIDDRHALVEAFADPLMRHNVPQYAMDSLELAGEYIDERAAGWARGDHCTWAIAEPTTGVLLGEVGLKGISTAGTTGAVAVWVHPSARRTGVATAAVDTVVRFGFGAIGLELVEYVCDEDNEASAALAQRCGFTLAGTTTSAAGVPSLLWTRRAEVP